MLALNRMIKLSRSCLDIARDWPDSVLKDPLLIYTNTSDDDVNVVEVESMIRALKAEGKKFEYKIDVIKLVLYGCLKFRWLHHYSPPFQP